MIRLTNKTKTFSQGTVLPLQLDSICHGQEGHQVTGQEITRPLLPYLTLQVVYCDLEMFLVDPWRDRFDSRGQFVDDVVHECHCDRCAVVHPRSILDPLP